MSNLARRHQWTAWCRRIERLSDFPWALHVARGDLQIAAGQVDADGIAVDAIIGLGYRDISSAALQRNHKLDFVVHILGQRRIRYGAAVWHNGVRRLREEERGRALVLPHFANVLDVIAADAPDAADGEHLVGACNRDCSLRPGRNDVAAVGHDRLDIALVRQCSGCATMRVQEKMGVRIRCRAPPSTAVYQDATATTGAFVSCSLSWRR